MEQWIRCDNGIGLNVVIAQVFHKIIVVILQLS
jgi:hypothetical protein